MSVEKLTLETPFPENDADPEKDEDGIEKERPEHDGKINEPYDPELIRIRPTHIVVDQVITRLKFSEIDLAPDFQRHAGIWTRTNKSRLIESLLLRIPIPAFYVAADESELWSVVDGIQRMSTIDDYVNDRFKLSGIQYLNKFEGLRFRELPRPMQRRISETQLVVNVIEPGTPEDVKIDVFRRINTLGSPLSAQEIRHALHPDPVRSLLKHLATSREFLDATHGSISPRRMRDREFVLRFLAFHIGSPERYHHKSLDGFLGDAMATINKMDAVKRELLSEEFLRSMRVARRIFGEYAFRKRYKHQDRKRPVNTALFETWGVHLARRSPDQQNDLIRRKKHVVSRSIKIMKENSDFDDAVSTSTGSASRVQKRFNVVGQIIEEFVPC